MNHENGANIPSPLMGEGEGKVLSRKRLCRKSIHGSTGSPRTDYDTSEINYLAVRPELVEGRAANCTQSPSGEENYFLFMAQHNGRERKRSGSGRSNQRG